MDIYHNPDDYDVSIKNAIFSYIDDYKKAIDDITLNIFQGERLLITGPGGAGKTTFCCCLNGLVPHFYEGTFSGKIIVKGIDTAQTSIGQLSQKVGVVFQDPSSQLVSPTVEEELAFGPENLGIPRDEIKERINEIIKATRLERFQERQPQTLSGGEQQAVAVASILAMHPDICVLDEPTSNLDPIGSSMVLSIAQDLAKRGEKTLIIVSHKIKEIIPIIDTIIIMNEGKIIHRGTPRKVLQNVEFMNKLGIGGPPVIFLADKLRKNGLIKSNEDLWISFEEAYTALSNLLKGVSSEKFENVLLNWENKKRVLKPSEQGEPVIEVKDLNHVYEIGPGIEGVVALRGVNLNIFQGEYVGIIGQNGSGKTTLVKHFNGLLKPTEGFVKVFGKDTTKVSIPEMAKKVNYIFQNPDLQLFGGTVREEVSFGPKNLGLSEIEVEKRVKSALEELDLEYAIDRIPRSLDKGGRQRVAIASALSMDPHILIIDEPTTGQDPKKARQIMELTKELNKKGKTIIFITHNMELAAEYAKRIIVMNNGLLLYDGAVRDAYSQTDILEKTYLKPPQITQLAQKLGSYGVPTDILTIDEMYEVIVELIGE